MRGRVPPTAPAPLDEASPGRSGVGWGLWLGILAVLCLSVAGGLFLLASGDTDGGDQASGAGATSAATAPPTKDDAPSTRPSDPARPTSSQPVPTVTVTRTAQPTDLTDCGDGAFAAGTASCPFAISVAAAYRASGGSRTLTDVYSPVTELYYDLTCVGTAPTECRVGRARILIY